jgi:hypothetical protein
VVSKCRSEDPRASRALPHRVIANGEGRVRVGAQAARICLIHCLQHSNNPEVDRSIAGGDGACVGEVRVGHTAGVYGMIRCPELAGHFRCGCGQSSAPLGTRACHGERWKAPGGKLLHSGFPGCRLRPEAGTMVWSIYNSWDHAISAGTRL